MFTSYKQLWNDNVLFDIAIYLDIFKCINVITSH